MGQHLSRLCGQRKQHEGSGPFDRNDGHSPPHYEHDLSAGTYFDAEHMSNDDNEASNAFEDPYAGLSEVRVPPPVQNTDESAQFYTHHTLEDEMRERSR